MDVFKIKQDRMQDDIKEMKKEMKEWFWKLESLISKSIEKSERTFATKTEIDNLKERQDAHSSYFKWVITALLWLVIVGIGNAIIV